MKLRCKFVENFLGTAKSVSQANGKLFKRNVEDAAAKNGPTKLRAQLSAPSQNFARAEMAHGSRQLTEVSNVATGAVDEADRSDRTITGLVAALREAKVGYDHFVFTL